MIGVCLPLTQTDADSNRVCEVKRVIRCVWCKLECTARVVNASPQLKENSIPTTTERSTRQYQRSERVVEVDNNIMRIKRLATVDIVIARPSRSSCGRVDLAELRACVYDGIPHFTSVSGHKVMWTRPRKSLNRHGCHRPDMAEAPCLFLARVTTLLETQSYIIGRNCLLH